jgi:hypothetical protein
MNKLWKTVRKLFQATVLLVYIITHQYIIFNIARFVKQACENSFNIMDV